MVTVTPRAAEQIRTAARQSHLEGLALRLAAKRSPDGTIQYGMGFDDVGHEADLHFNSEGVELVIAPVSLDLLTGTVLDYVELEPGNHQFIFMNPNDPDYVPPSEPA